MIYKNELKVNFTGNTEKLKAATQKASEQTSRAAKKFGNDWKRASNRASSAAKNSLNKISSGFKKISSGAKDIAKIGTVAIAGFSAVSIKEFMKFEKGMTQVWTLTNQSKKEFANMSNEVLKLMLRGGTATETLTKGLYDATSAGIKAKDSIKFMALAQDVALASATDTAIAVDGLTSVINAYKKSLGTTKLKQAQKAAEIFFNTIKYGKTTFAELAPEMGRIAPIAAQMGISFDEIGAATASLTLTGSKTNATIVALRQVLLSVAKPSERAKKLAKELGIEFNLEALKAKGLAKYLRHVYKATGGNVAKMTQLFGNVRALVGALGLTGNQMKKYAEIQKLVSSETGNFSAAVIKMKGTTAYAWDRMVAYGHVKMIQFGQGIAEAIKVFSDERPELAGFTDDMRLLGKTLASFVIVNFFRFKVLVLETIAVFFNWKNTLNTVLGYFGIFGWEVVYIFKKAGINIKYIFKDVWTHVRAGFFITLEYILKGLAKIYNALPGEKAKISSQDYARKATEFNLKRRLERSKMAKGTEHKKELDDLKKWRKEIEEKRVEKKFTVDPMALEFMKQAAKAQKMVDSFDSSAVKAVSKKLKIVEPLEKIKLKIIKPVEKIQKKEAIKPLEKPKIIKLSEREKNLFSLLKTSKMLYTHDEKDIEKYKQREKGSTEVIVTRADTEQIYTDAEKKDIRESKQREKEQLREQTRKIQKQITGQKETNDLLKTIATLIKKDKEIKKAAKIKTFINLQPAN